MNFFQCEGANCEVRANRLMMSAKLFRGLADPTRLSILRALCNGPLRVVDLCEVTGRAQPNVSAHLANLREIGLVVGKHAGRETFYSIRDERMKVILSTTEALTGIVKPGLCRCDWLDSRSSCEV